MTARSLHDCAGLNEDFGWQLGSLYRAYARAAGTTLAELPGGPRGYLVLTAAEAGNSSTQLGLATQMGVDRTVMTYLLDDLESAGLVERQPDPADRRARRIALTAAGAERLATANESLRRAEEYVLAVLSPDERAAFRRLLGRVGASLNDHDSAGDACRVAAELA